MDNLTEESATNIDFWIKEAGELKKAADSCWNLEITIHSELLQGERYEIDKELLKKTGNMEVDMNRLAGSLSAFAIQYLAIGILINRNPQRFLQESPGTHIRELVEECGIDMNDTQRKFLSQVDDTFTWMEKFPQWKVSLPREEIYELKSKLREEKTLTPEEKAELDNLYFELESLAINERDESRDKQSPTN